MYFFNDKTFAASICQKAVEGGVVQEAKHSNAERGVACFYIEYDDVQAHKRVLQFMLENIAAALNQYDVVFAEMGAGHYLDLVPALQQMLGDPQVLDGEKLPKQTLWRQCNWDGLQEIVLIK